MNCSDERKKQLKKLILKNWASFCTNDTQCSKSSLQPLDAEELDPTRQYSKMTAKRLVPIDKKASDDQLAMMIQLKIIR